MSSRRSSTDVARSVTGAMPRPPETLVARERLHSFLDSATELPLTQLIAPAGTGKTVLASAWATQESSTPGASDIDWLGAAEHNRLAARLLAGTSATRSRRPTPAAVVRTLRGQLEENPLQRPDLLIIDDAHLLDRSDVELLAAVLTEVPDAVRLLIASRRDINLPIVELALHGKTTSLRGRQLRFTPSEATRLVRSHAPDVAVADIESLHRRTDGWAAALVLAARTLGSGGDPGLSRDLLEGTDQPVLDFLLSEAFATLGPTAQQVLLSTFEEPELSVRAAAVLSGVADAGSLLSELAESGLLVSAHLTDAEDTPVFRYHPLLIELLRREAVRPGEHSVVVVAAHRRAAVDAAEHSRIPEAIQHALRARDDDLLAELLSAHGPALLCAGQHPLIELATNSLGPATYRHHPALHGIAALSRREAGDTSEAVRLSTRAIGLSENATRGTAADDRLHLDAGILRLWLSRYGWHETAGAIAVARELLGCVYDRTGAHTAHRTRLVVEPERLAWLLIELGSTEIWAGDLVSAELHLDEALVSARMSGSDRLAADALAHLSVIHYSRSAIRTARAAAEQALAAGGTGPDRAIAVLGLTAFHQLDTTAAATMCADLEDRESDATDGVVTTLLLMLRALLLTERGELDEARRVLTTQPVTTGLVPGFLARELAMMRWLCALLGSDTATAVHQLDILSEAGYHADVHLLTALGTALSGADDTLVAIERALEDDTVSHPLLVAAATGVRVALLVRSGDRDQASTCLTTLLSQVAPQQPLQALTFAASDPGFLDLLYEAGRQPAVHPYAPSVYTSLSRYRAVRSKNPLNAALTPRPDSRTPGTATAARTRHPSSQRSLINEPGSIPIRITAREGEVLRQLSLGGSYTDIGDALFITENTVKTHLTSLYRKLGVEKRSAALRIARERGLL